MTPEQQQAAEHKRPDLKQYVESPRFALTWDDVAYYESIGRPYPLSRLAPLTLEPSTESATLRAFKTLFGIS